MTTLRRGAGTKADPIVLGGSGRSRKWCKCHTCGTVARETKNFEFYVTSGKDVDYLTCDTCIDKMFRELEGPLLQQVQRAKEERKTIMEKKENQPDELPKRKDLLEYRDAAEYLCKLRGVRKDATVLIGTGQEALVRGSISHGAQLKEWELLAIQLRNQDELNSALERKNYIGRLQQRAEANKKKGVA